MTEKQGKRPQGQMVPFSRDQEGGGVAQKKGREPEDPFIADRVIDIASSNAKDPYCHFLSFLGCAASSTTASTRVAEVCDCHLPAAGIVSAFLRSGCRKRGGEFKGGSLHDGFGGSGKHLALLLLVLQNNRGGFSAVAAVLVVTATPPNSTPPCPTS